jgi:hypothetical protein
MGKRETDRDITNKKRRKNNSITEHVQLPAQSQEAQRGLVAIYKVQQMVRADARHHSVARHHVQTGHDHYETAQYLSVQRDTSAAAAAETRKAHP